VNAPERLADSRAEAAKPHPGVDAGVSTGSPTTCSGLVHSGGLGAKTPLLFTSSEREKDRNDPLGKAAQASG